MNSFSAEEQHTFDECDKSVPVEPHEHFYGILIAIDFAVEEYSLEDWTLLKEAAEQLIEQEERIVMGIIRRTASEVIGLDMAEYALAVAKMHIALEKVSDAMRLNCMEETLPKLSAKGQATIAPQLEILGLEQASSSQTDWLQLANTAPEMLVEMAKSAFAELENCN